jgi:hypothetical protein
MRFQFNGGISTDFAHTAIPEPATVTMTATLHATSNADGNLNLGLRVVNSNSTVTNFQVHSFTVDRPAPVVDTRPAIGLLFDMQTCPDLANIGTVATGSHTLLRHANFTAGSVMTINTEAPRTISVTNRHTNTQGIAISVDWIKSHLARQDVDPETEYVINITGRLGTGTGGTLLLRNRVLGWGSGSSADTPSGVAAENSSATAAGGAFVTNRVVPASEINAWPAGAAYWITTNQSASNVLDIVVTGLTITAQGGTPPLFPVFGEIFDLQKYLTETKEIGDNIGSLQVSSTYITRSSGEVTALTVSDAGNGNRFLDVVRQANQATRGPVITVPGGFRAGDIVTATGRALTGSEMRFQFNGGNSQQTQQVTVEDGQFTMLHRMTAQCNGGDLNRGLRVVSPGPTTLPLITNFQVDTFTVYRPAIALTGVLAADNGNLGQMFSGEASPTQSFVLRNNTDAAITGLTVNTSPEFAVANLPAALGAGQFLTVTLSATGASVGQHTSALTISGQTASGPYTSAPINAGINVLSERLFPEQGYIFDLQIYLGSKDLGEDVAAPSASVYITRSHPTEAISAVVSEGALLYRYLDVTRPANGSRGPALNIPGGFRAGDVVTVSGRAEGTGNARFQYNITPNDVPSPPGQQDLEDTGVFTITHTISASDNNGNINTNLRIIGTTTASITNFQIDNITVYRPLIVDFPEGYVFHLATYLEEKNVGDSLMTGSLYINPSHNNVTSLGVGELWGGKILNVTRATAAPTRGPVVSIPNGGFKAGDIITATGYAASGEMRFQFQGAPSIQSSPYPVIGGEFAMSWIITAEGNKNHDTDVDGGLDTGMRIINTNGNLTNFQVAALTVFRPVLAISGETADDTGNFFTIIEGEPLPDAQSFTLTNNGDETITGLFSNDPFGFDVLGVPAALEAGESAKITVQPNSEFIGSYTTELIIVSSEEMTHPIDLIFDVLSATSLVYNAGVITATVDGWPVSSPANLNAGDNIVFSVTPDSSRQIAVWSVNGVVQSGDASNTFTYQNLQSHINVTVRLLNTGAVATGGTGNVTSADITWLARSVANHPGFELEEQRLGNLRGLDREPRLADITQMLRWLVGYDLELLRTQTQTV